MNNDRRALKIINLLKEEYPEAGTRLHFSDSFELLVAVVLSAQSTDEQVNKVTAGLFKKYDTPGQFAGAELQELEGLIRGVGLYKNKARHIKELSAIIGRDYGGQVPGDFDELIKLPGVGRKTANVVLAVGFGKPGLGVDTHVKRVAGRLGIASGKSAAQIENGLKQAIPVKLWGEAHHLLIAHGRTVCRARKPGCADCVLHDLCERNME
ncbi:endonuclease III [Syntrophomonas curvata]